MAFGDLVETTGAEALIGTVWTAKQPGEDPAYDRVRVEAGTVGVDASGTRIAELVIAPADSFGQRIAASPAIFRDLYTPETDLDDLDGKFAEFARTA